MCIENSLTKFDRITLDQMDSVKLMNRSDRKYWFHGSLLESLLEEIAQDYYILEIGGECNLPYSTTYYDTQHDDMYRNHHRGKRNRYKIRRRSYLSTNSSFLEVKFKTNKGRTLKSRQPSHDGNSEFEADESSFLNDNTPYQCEELKEVLQNRFRRLMLVSKQMNERCTIDSEIQFVGGENQVKLDNLVIVEVKTEGRAKTSIINSLNRHRIKSSGFSKYCIGRSLTDEALQHNNFKLKHREIAKIINNPIKY